MAAQQADSGGYVTRLGLDTIAVETFVRTEDRLEGTRISRSPETTTIHYLATLNGSGRVTRFAAELRAGDRTAGATRWTSVTEFGAREVVTTFTGSEGTRTIRQTPESEVFPLLTNSYALYEQGLRQARRAGGRVVSLQIMYPGQEQLTPSVVHWLGHDSVAISSFHGVDAIGVADRDGRLLSYDAGATVVKVRADRVAHLDLATLGRQFADADSAGRGMGQVSTRDTARVVVGGVKLSVDYGRPSKRGRVIYGGLVPWGKVWRTGANAATQIFLDRDVMLGGFRLPAGRYSLWTVPTPDGASLIVNRESGQWGTDYRGGYDLTRIPLTTAPLDQVVERFTIEFAHTSETATELHLKWDTTDWSVPIRLP